MTEREKELVNIHHGDKCPVCNGKIKASGFNGNLFCWGKCYCYINSQKYQKLFEKIENYG